MQKPLIIHPFLFAISPILFLYSHNIEQVSVYEFVVAAGIMVLFVFLLWLLLSFVSVNKKKIALVMSLAILVFFSYGHFYNAAMGLTVAGFEFGRQRYVVPVWGMIFVFGTYLIIRTRKSLDNLTTIFNVVAASLVVMPILNVGVYELKRANAAKNDTTVSHIEVSTADLDNTTKLPDIYYIILDAYASSKTLKEIYGYENREFERYLTDNGFYIASESRSNYPSTFLSLASSLNMEYLNTLSEVVGIESDDMVPVYRMIGHNKLVRFLKSKAYKIVNIGTVPVTERNGDADWNVRCGTWLGGEFQSILIQTTMLDLFSQTTLPDLLDETTKYIDSTFFHRKKILCAFSKLGEVQHEIEGPRFVFAHILSPHKPYAFGPGGEPVYGELIFDWRSSRQEKERYLGQLIFVNNKIREVVTKILSEAESEPIIIIQSDHGPPIFEDPTKPNEKYINQTMRIFNAYYLPKNGKNLLYDSITPVNTFRLILSHYLNMNYELLEDKSYFTYHMRPYRPYNRPYKFVDVTDILNREEWASSSTIIK